MKRGLAIFTAIFIFVASLAVAGQVRVTFWEGMGGPLGNTLKTITALFNKENPNIDVKLVFVGSGSQLDSKILTAAAADTLPTMAQSYPAWTAKLVYEGKVVPVDSFSDFQSVASDFYPSIVDMGRMKGRVYALPFNLENYVLYYRPQMLAEAGITPPKTIKELETDAKILTVKKDGKTTRYGLAFRTNVEMFTSVALQFGGGTYITDSGRITINSTANVEALTFLTNLVRGGYAYETAGYPDHLLTTSSVALLLGGGAWLPYDISDIAGQKDGLRMVPVPYGPNGKTTPAMKGESLVIFTNATTEQRDAAWKYIRFLMSPTVQAYWGMQTNYSPLNRKVTSLEQWKLYLESSPNDPAPIAQGLENAISESELLPWWPAVQLDIKTAIADAVNNVKTPQQALDWAQSQAESVYKNYSR